MSLRKKTITATKWSTVFMVIQQVFAIIVTVVLARLLTPKDFGLMAIVAAVIGFMRMFQDVGLGPALIQKKDIDDEHLNAVFWGMLVIGVLLFLLFCSTSLLIARFYDDLRLKYLIVICSTGFILSPFYSVHLRILERRMDFKTLGIVSITASVLSGFIAIYLALIGWGVWSLVVQFLLFYILSPIIIWRYVEWRPKFSFSWEKCKELLSFGTKLSASKVVSYMKLNIVYLIVGRVLGPNPLGLYKIGSRVVNQPLLNVSTIFSRTLLTSYSKTQDDSARLKGGYLITLHYMGLIIMPIAVGIMVAAPEIVYVLLGDKWAGAIPIIQFLCIAGTIDIFVNTGTSVCYAKGHPGVALKWNVLALVTYIPVILLAANYGITAVARSLMLVSIPLFIVMQSFVNNMLGLSWKPFVKNLQQPFLISIIMASLVYAARYRLLQLDLERSQMFIIEILVGVACYVSLNFCLNRNNIVQGWIMFRNR